MKKGLIIGLVLGLVIGVVVSVAFMQMRVVPSSEEVQEKLGCPTIGAQYCWQLIIEKYDWTNLTYLEVTLRSVGPKPLFISQIVLAGKAMAPPQTYDELSGDCTHYFDLGANGLLPGNTCLLGIVVGWEPDSDWSCTFNAVPGQAYPLTVYTYGGAVFTYSVLAGMAGS